MPKPVSFLARAISVAIIVFAAPSAFAQDLTLSIRNGTASPLLGIYVSAVGLENWQDNLVARPLPPGASASATIADAEGDCRFDLRIELADADPFVDDDVDLCGLTEYTVKDED